MRYAAYCAASILAGLITAHALEKYLEHRYPKTLGH